MTDSPIPERLGAYRLESSLGRGGMGEVFLAWDERLERHVAIKRILADPAPGERARARFRREAKAVARLSHPAIVQVFDLLETESGDCLVMEYVEGRGLQEVIAEGDLDLETVLCLGSEIAQGLSEAHTRGLVHRDLKPENVQVTRAGHAKILDFGLAALLWSDASDADSRAATLAETAVLDPPTALTRPGALLGTVHAMSPEQASGRPVDHRSDLFALGGLLYEMLAGRAPFRGANMLDTLRRVTSESQVPLAELRPDLPSALVELIDGLLAKEPAQRPQNARLVADTLDRLRSRSASDPIGSGAVGPLALGTPISSTGSDPGDLPTGEWPAPAMRSYPAARIAAGVILVALIVATAVALLRGSGHSIPEPAAIGSPDKRSLAVLWFQNLSADPDLAWWRHGISEMLITDLSQSPELEVLSLDGLTRLVRAFHTGDGEPSGDVVHELAARAEVDIDIVLEGSFARSGGVVRILFTVKQADTGEILVSDRREGAETDLFQMVDDLSQTVRRRLEVPHRHELAASVAEITTSSIDAWRLFTEGMKLHRQSKDREALPLLEAAVAIDPDFALALANLGVLNGNLGQAGQARDYGRRALELAEHLPIQQRYFVEGWYHSARWRTYGQAIAAYRKGLDFFPENRAFRGNLAELLSYLERYEDAIGEYRVLIDRGDDFAPTYYSLAAAYAATGDFETGGELLSSFGREDPENWFGQLAYGWHLTGWGRLDEALGPLRRAIELHQGDVFVHYGWWRLRILRQEWDRAQAEADAMAIAGDPYSRWRSLVSMAFTHLYRGRSGQALTSFEASIQAYPEPEANTALSHCWASRLLLQKGLPAQALAAALKARSEAPGEWPELEGLFLAALARQAMGQPAEADRLAAELSQRMTQPNVVEQRQIHHLAGRLALARGDLPRAVDELNRAVALLPVRGLQIHDHARPDHVPLWYALGEVELAADRLDEAIGWFRKVADSGVEHVEHPALYARSFFRLAELYRSLGELDASRLAHQRFLELWLDGDLDREAILTAASDAA